MVVCRVVVMVVVVVVIMTLFPTPSLGSSPNDVRPDHIRYCEQRLPNGTYANARVPLTHWPFEYSNAVSSLFFLATPLFSWFYPRGYPATSTRVVYFHLYNVWQVIHALCTFSNHAFQTRLALSLDNWSVWSLLSFVVLFVLFYRIRWRRCCCVRWTSTKASVLCFLCLFGSISLMWAMLSDMETSAAFQSGVQGVHIGLIVVLGVVSLCQTSRAATRRRRRDFGVAVGLTVVGVVFALLDPVACVYVGHGHYWGSHSLWHVCGALALGWLGLYMFRAESSRALSEST